VTCFSTHTCFDMFQYTYVFLRVSVLVRAVTCFSTCTYCDVFQYTYVLWRVSVLIQAVAGVDEAVLVGGDSLLHGSPHHPLHLPVWERRPGLEDNHQTFQWNVRTSTQQPCRGDVICTCIYYLLIEFFCLKFHAKSFVQNLNHHKICPTLLWWTTWKA